MKVARLHDGMVLKFPPETPDEAIDLTVDAYHKKHGEEIEGKRKQKETESATSERHHKELVEGIGHMLQLHAKTLQAHGELLKQATLGHREIIGRLDKLTNAVNTPKKRKVIRDKDNKISEVHEYV